MNSVEIFSMALGLSSPWFVSKAEFIEVDNIKELHLWISYERGFCFQASDGSSSTSYDTLDKQWRHLNFFQHRCYIHCSVPRIKYGDNKISMVDVPWSRPNSGFTLLFEAYAMLLIEQEMPVSSVSRTIKETAPRIWRLFSYWVKDAYSKEDWSKIKRIGVDETSSKRGHQYITEFVDLDTRRVLFATQGKDADTFRRFKEELVRKKGLVSNIQLISMDMSVAFISGRMEYFPEAQIVFDKFHIVQSLNKSMDEVRKIEQNSSNLLKGERYTLLYRKSNLSVNKLDDLNRILIACPVVGEAYGYKESFMDVFTIADPEEAKAYLTFWSDCVMGTMLSPFKRFVNMLKAHWFGISSYFDNKGVSNGVLEGINSKIQLAKRRARGYANINNFISMIYLIAGKLKMAYPHETL